VSYSRSDARRAGKNLVLRWGSDPVRFATEALGQKLAPDQERILESVASHKYVAVRSGQKTGKSTACAIVVIWWVLTRARGYGVLTAPSFTQVEDPLWKEVRRLHREAAERGVPLGGDMHVSPAAGWRLPGDRRAFGRSTDSAERMQGTSSPHILYVVDEASGYPAELWEPLLGNMAGGGKLLAISNPTQTAGQFYDAFTVVKDPKPCAACGGVEHGLWKPIHLRSDRTPNYLERRQVIPGLAEYEWVEERRREWGEESVAFQVRVRGNFPTQPSNAVVPLGLVSAAIERYPKTEGVGLLNIGVDVARFGDDETVIQPRRGNRALEPVVISSADNVDVAGRVLAVARTLRESPREVPSIKIDEIGNGSGVVDLLRRSKEVEVIGVNVAQESTTDDHHRLRDQLWFALRDWLAAGGAIPDDARLASELVAPTYSFDARGRFQVQSKDEIKKVLRRSPDRADALALSIFAGRPAVRNAYSAARAHRASMPKALE
jgi:phage terminase large subunit